MRWDASRRGCGFREYGYGTSIDVLARGCGQMRVPSLEISRQSFHLPGAARRARERDRPVRGLTVSSHRAASGGSRRYSTCPTYATLHACARGLALLHDGLAARVEPAASR